MVPALSRLPEYVNDRQIRHTSAVVAVVWVVLHPTSRLSISSTPDAIEIRFSPFHMSRPFLVDTRLSACRPNAPEARDRRSEHQQVRPECADDGLHQMSDLRRRRYSVASPLMNM